MNIIIAGAGKVGLNVAGHLVAEGHNVTLMDTAQDTLDKASNQLDVMCIRGNGASRAALMEAGIRDADMVIAATGSDEINLLCCHCAHSLGVSNTVARVRSAEYAGDLENMKQDLGIDMLVNPELATAVEISRLLRFPNAANIDTFARGRVDGYFEGQPPEVFWQLLSCYVCRGLFNGLAWAAPRGDEQIGLMKLHAAHVRDWYAGGAVIPKWYRPLGLKRGTVRLESHDPCWPAKAADCISQLKALLGDIAVDVQHVGSTAIGGIHAKPILDIAVGMPALEDVEKRIPLLEQHHMIYRGQDHSGQLLFVKGDFARDIRTHHINVLVWGSETWENYLNFRDYLNAHPEKAAEYDRLKIALAQAYGNDRGAYTAGKGALVAALLQEARLWRK